MEGARAEERRRLMAIAKMGSPFEIVDEAHRAMVAPAPPPEPTFAEVSQRFLTEYAASQFKPSTLYGYETNLRVWLLPRLGALPVSGVTMQAAWAIDAAIVKSGACDATRRTVLSVLRSILRKFAVEAGILKEAPKLPKLPQVKQTIHDAPTAEDFARVLAAVNHSAHRLAFLVAGHAGLRRGEIRALRCGDVDLSEHGRIVVRLSRYRNVTTTPKSGSERVIPMTLLLRAELVAAGVATRPKDAPVALSTLGKPWGMKGLRDAFARVQRRVGVGHFRFHALRHFFVTALLDAGVASHVVRELAGHSDLATTQRYAHVRNTARVDAITALDGAFAAEPTAPDAQRRGVRLRSKGGKGRVLLLRARAIKRARGRGNVPVTAERAA